MEAAGSKYDVVWGVGNAKDEKVVAHKPPFSGQLYMDATICPVSLVRNPYGGIGDHNDFPTFSRPDMHAPREQKDVGEMEEDEG